MFHREQPPPLEAQNFHSSKIATLRFPAIGHLHGNSDPDLQIHGSCWMLPRGSDRDLAADCRPSIACLGSPTHNYV